MAGLEASLRLLDTDHVDIFQLHGVAPGQYDHAMSLVPAMQKARDQGKICFLGITESGAGDQTHGVLRQATADGVWDVVMVAFNMLHRTASDTLFPHTSAKGVGTLVMHAVRSIFARPDFLAASIRELAASGQVPRWGADDEDSKTPIMANFLRACDNLLGCFDGTLAVEDAARGKHSRLADEGRARPIKRVPGLALHGCAAKMSQVNGGPGRHRRDFVSIPSCRVER